MLLPRPENGECSHINAIKSKTAKKGAHIKQRRSTTCREAFNGMRSAFSALRKNVNHWTSEAPPVPLTPSSNSREDRGGLLEAIAVSLSTGADKCCGSSNDEDEDEDEENDDFGCVPLPLFSLAAEYEPKAEAMSSLPSSGPIPWLAAPEFETVSSHGGSKMRSGADTSAS